MPAFRPLRVLLLQLFSGPAQLEQHFRLEWGRQQAARVDWRGSMAEVVDRVMETIGQPDAGLFSGLEQEHPAQRERIAFCQLLETGQSPIEALPEQLVLPRRLWELGAELVQILRDPDALRQAWSASLPPGSAAEAELHLLAGEQDIALLVLESLRTLAGFRAIARPGEGEEDVPLLRFVERLRPGGDSGTKLDRWLSAARAELGLAQPAGAAPPPPRWERLVVRVRRFAEDRWAIKAMLLGEGEPLPLLSTAEPVTRAEIEARVQRLRSEVTGRGLLPDQLLAAHFIVPRQLVCTAVDRWSYAIPRIRGQALLPLGIEHPVVISLEEPAETGPPEADRERRLQAEARWQSLSRCGPVQQVPELLARLDELDRHRAVWVPQTAQSRAFDVLVAARSVVCALLEAAPEAPVREDDPDILLDLWEAGVPIALWARRPLAGDPGACRDLLEAILKGHSPLDLPRRVHALRRAAGPAVEGDPPHLGHHIALYWDQPDLLPGDEPMLITA